MTEFGRKDVKCDNVRTTGAEDLQYILRLEIPINNVRIVEGL